MRREPSLLVLGFTIAVSTSCDKAPGRDAAPSPDSTSVGRADSVARAQQDSINRAQPGYIVDSILPIDEAMRRFNADLPSRPTALANGASSRDALVEKWVRALETNDSLTLIRTAINRPEFALLVYPTSRNTKPPQRQVPGIVWMQLSMASSGGFRRTLSRLGGASLGYLSYRCATTPEVEGVNRFWNNCQVQRVLASGDTVYQKLFGTIIERHGHFKFLTLASDM